MKKTFQPILIALAFAILLIASSYFFKSKPAGDWIDSVIYIAGLLCLVAYLKRDTGNC
jgi:hypothetical protein